MTDVAALADLFASRVTALDRRPVLVGLTGSVAVGKSVLAGELAATLESRHGLRTDVVSTDGFLYPNSVLDPRGLTLRKGFPETYDTAGLLAFLESVRRGERPRVPLYDHASYDVIPDGRDLAPADVVLFEGLALLGPDAAVDGRRVADLLDETIYLDADHDTIRTWFVERFMALRDAAKNDPTSFYAMFAAMDDESALAAAHFVWDEINAPNLRDHIEPGREEASILVTKQPDHSLRSIIER